MINTSVQCTLGDFLGVSLICNPFDNVKYSIENNCDVSEN